MKTEITKTPRKSRYDDAIITAAKMLFLQRVAVRDIKTQLNINSTRVIYQWVEKFGWENLLSHETPLEAANRRLTILLDKDKKTSADYKEITELGNIIDKLVGVELKRAKIQRENNFTQQSANEKNRSQGGGKPRGKYKNKGNEIGSITAGALKELREKLFFEYQKNWFGNIEERTRFILKSRQIGATFYFAWEAFEDAVLNGRNKIFLSASKNQAYIFKTYIMRFALEYFDIELKGAEKIELTKDGKPWAILGFLSCNARTAQGFTGDLYVDEVFWINDFERVNDLAGAIAAHKHWRKTYFSTPSSKSHSAYKLWSGEIFNSERKTKINIDLKHETLVNGHRGPDRIWRNIITVVDAQERGCNLFDIEQIRSERKKSVFDNLFMCKFIEAGASVFNLSDLLSCGIEDSSIWQDFDLTLDRPFGNQEVWIGYDPARFGDKSMIAVISPPVGKYKKFRVLELVQASGSYPHQAEQIKRLTEKYRVTFLAIDTTGQGTGVFDLVKEFYPSVHSIHYGIDTKTRLVLKGIDVIENKKIEWDVKHREIAPSFMQIRQAVTKSNESITYKADRTTDHGHADYAWALLHALSNEPLTGKRKQSSLAISQ